ncbi:error-prone DNA polymerase [Bradyrhizobium symbiodeficiens]|uniref:Error-prone DNA polymerase n=1 Tax=Bradyrhizobium symbiodeficiens TaxID=1404367 RepID=A0A6G8ZXF4_9BRAD|nr:error-prone DNA polymerase [Bradyrhizobium symbiodeficiens]QIP04871.1 error-prone DNA polymerase [Bradyrhizobium symbiodeficiens]
MSTPAYAEIGITTNFSFLRGGSDPRAYVHQASKLGLPAIGIADHNTLAGVVRAWNELGNDKVLHKPKLLIGARIVFSDGTPDILVYPRDRAAYGRLCQLLTRGKRGDDITRIEKGECRLAFADLLEFSQGQLLVLTLPHRFEPAQALDILAKLKASRAEGVWLAASLIYRGDDRRRLARLDDLAAKAKVPLLATNEVLYHDPGRRPLQDVLTCIREKTTIETVGRKLEANAERFLKTPREMARLFRDFPDAIAETMRFAGKIDFSLDQLKYQYPDEPVPPGKTAQEHLEDLTWAGVDKYFGGVENIDAKLRATLHKELALIAELKYAHYFLTVHDIVHYARSQNILCQGRGSAANSAVCYVLGITSVDPTKVDLLFERFISKERLEPPDIDVDFEHSRREEVMQYVYRRYGRHRAAIIATVIHYRPRSAIRDVGKALGLTEDVTAALADTVWGSWGKGLNDMQVRQAGLDPGNPMINLAVELATELIEFPRHLSQHVGGYVLTQDRLDTYVPIGNAAMDDRTFIEWDKDDVDALNMMKVDVLALGMLTCIRKCFDLIDQHKGERWVLASVPQDDPEVYDMLCDGESLGVFQVESRAQMNMLPRLKPRTFYDLVIEVAIVRPGPIQGDMVHPYLRRRKMNPADIEYPYPKGGNKNELREVLHKTLGVPLFQEQAMRIAIVAAEFTSEEANGLRRAMATFRNVGTIGNFEEKMIGNMIRRGYDPQFARNCFDQIKGFGSYGFPESHAASFAQLVYISSWLKYHHPDAFCCGLLNSQPMGFYAPAQIVNDARKNGVEIRDIDVSYSFAQNTLENTDGKYCAVRLGFRQIDGFHWLDEDEEQLKRSQSSFRGAQSANPESQHTPGGMDSGLDADALPRNGNVERVLDWADQIVAARNRRPFTSLEDFARDTGLPKRALILLADADAFRSLGLDRREALWQVRRLPDDLPLPLFEAATAREQPDEHARPLPVMPRAEQVVADYQTIRLSLKGHPMKFLREMFSRERVVACREISHENERRRVRCAGVVLVRQRPGSASGVVFMTLEDETGIANVVVWPKIMEQYRKEVMGARLIEVHGYIQSSPEKVTHLIAQRLIDRSHDLVGLANDALSRKHPLPAGATVVEPLNEDPRALTDMPAQKIRHPRNVRILPPSRDFH